MKHGMIVWNLVLSALLLGILVRDARRSPVQPNQLRLAAIKTQSLEITDAGGKTLVSLSARSETNANPKMIFYNSQGRQAAMLIVSDRGYAKLFINSNRTLGKVSLGYLEGDSPAPLDREDAASGWGLNVLTDSGKSYGFGEESGGRLLIPTK